MHPHLDKGDVVEVLRVWNSQAPHAVGMSPLLEVSVEVPAKKQKTAGKTIVTNKKQEKTYERAQPQQTLRVEHNQRKTTALRKQKEKEKKKRVSSSREKTKK